jgi:metal-dependent amidase/aminoacylase/carboxypeptidase family protein
MSALGEILAGYGAIQASQEAFDQDLHRHPELSHQEHRTAGRVADAAQDPPWAARSSIPSPARGSGT